MEQIKYFFYFLVAVVVVWLILFLIDSQNQKNQNVIGYFHCKEKYQNFYYTFVLKKLDEEDFSVLEYKPLENILTKDKPSRLDDLTEIETSKREEKTTEFLWTEFIGKKSYINNILDRRGGVLDRHFYIGGEYDDTNFFNCKFGEEGKRLFWEHSQKTYNQEIPKF